MHHGVTWNSSQRPSETGTLARLTPERCGDSSLGARFVAFPFRRSSLASLTVGREPIRRAQREFGRNFFEPHFSAPRQMVTNSEAWHELAEHLGIRQRHYKVRHLRRLTIQDDLSFAEVPPRQGLEPRIFQLTVNEVGLACEGAKFRPFSRQVR